MKLFNPENLLSFTGSDTVQEKRSAEFAHIGPSSPTCIIVSSEKTRQPDGKQCEQFAYNNPILLPSRRFDFGFTKNVRFS